MIGVQFIGRRAIDGDQQIQMAVAVDIGDLEGLAVNLFSIGVVGVEDGGALRPGEGVRALGEHDGAVEIVEISEEHVGDPVLVEVAAEDGAVGRHAGVGREQRVHGLEVEPAGDRPAVSSRVAAGA